MSGRQETTHLETGVLIIGAGAAGLSAAVAAHDAGAAAMVVDRSLIGRGGATVMAQMTVAAALGDEVPDDWRFHLADTLKAGRGLCDEPLATLICERGPEAIRQMREWKVGWAQHEDGRLRQVEAPGHDRPRCVYVDFLNTGPAVSRTLRAQVQRREGIKRIGDLCITDLVVDGGVVTGAVGFSVSSGAPVSIAARAVIVATGGLTRLYRRNSASANMGGDGYALALRAGAELIDMEFVQFFPIGHLAPRLVGMDPIMWDPFRYKLGGQLLDNTGREFLNLHDVAESGRYKATRDVATDAILKEVAAGRGSPAGGVFLSFRHVPQRALREAFGPVIDRLAANGIDLTRDAVEVAPIAHYHMGGIRTGETFETRVPGVFAAGEAVGGANGANRLSGNAITEAFVFGAEAGRAAAAHAEEARAQAWRGVPKDGFGSRICRENPAALIVALQGLMDECVGPLRSAAGLQKALAQIAGLREALGDAPPEALRGFDTRRLDWFDARNMLLVAECVAAAALVRGESRGAHARADFPESDARFAFHRIVALEDSRVVLSAARKEAVAAL